MGHGRWLVVSLLVAGCTRVADAPDNAEGATAACNPQGVMQFLCGIEAVEDVAPVPGTRWLLAGGLGLGRPATIKLVDTVDGRVVSVYPEPAGDRADRRLYPECPGPPDPARFSTSGVALRSQSDQTHLFYAVHDGARKSVEVFEVDARASVPAVVWVGCIVLPEQSNPNAVAPLAGRGVAVVSMDDGAADRMERHIAGEASGSVYLWHPQSGLRQLSDVSLRGGNGIVVSPDERWLYVSAWSGGEIVRIDLQSGLSESVALDFLPDNLKWAADGSILVVGQRPPVSAIARCTGNPCPSDWLIAKIDPQTLRSRTLAEAHATSVVDYATGAVEMGDVLYVTNRGEGRIGIVREQYLSPNGRTRLDDAMDRP